MKFIAFITLAYTSSQLNLVMTLRKPQLLSLTQQNICNLSLKTKEYCSSQFYKNIALIDLSSVHNMDIVRLSETFHDSFVLTNDENFRICGYSSFRADHLTNTKLGGLIVFYKSYLHLKLTDIKCLHKYIDF